MATAKSKRDENGLPAAWQHSFLQNKRKSLNFGKKAQVMIITVVLSSYFELLVGHKNVQKDITSHIFFFFLLKYYFP